VSKEGNFTLFTLFTGLLGYILLNVLINRLNWINYLINNITRVGTTRRRRCRDHIDILVKGGVCK